VGQEWKGQHVGMKIARESKELVVETGQKEVKRLKLKGMVGGMLELGQWKEELLKEAKSERRGWKPK